MVKIEIFYNNKKYQVDFKIHKPMEFIQAMYIIGNEDYLNTLCEELNFEPDEELTNRINNAKNQLSRFSQRELEYFFGYEDLFGMVCFIIFMVDNLEASTVEKMITVIEESDLDEFIRNMVWQNIKEFLNKDDISETNHKNITLSEILNKISSVNTKETGLVEKAIEILENPDETKQRFCLLLRQFYEKAYKENEDEIIKSLQSHKDKYEKLFKENPHEFFKQFLKRDMDSTPSNKLVFHVSYWLQAVISITYNSDLYFIAIGLHIDKFYGNKAIKERLQKFFKVLSDKKRIDIIDILGERPHYVHEIAEKLDLTAATISYHLTFLYELDLVENLRQDHRIYYSLNKERAKELFLEAMSALLHE